MTGLRPGLSVDIWEEALVRAAAYVGEEKGRLKVITPQGKELRIPDSRVANVGGLAFDLKAAPAAIAKLLQAHEVELLARAATVDLQALWEVLADEGGQYALAELAELALGSRDGVARSATLRRLTGDNLYFVRKRLEFAPRSREEMDATVRRQKREDERVQLRAEFVRAAREHLANPIEPPPLWPKGSERFLDALRDFAVHALESERQKEAESLLVDLGVAGRGDPGLAAFETLVRLHVFAPDENLLVARHAIRRDFPAEALAEAERAVAAPAPAEPWRRDLTHLDCWAIDDAETTEVDDAVSLVELDEPGVVELGIHIADPTGLVLHGSPLDLVARDRATTYYLPEERILMLPPMVSEEAGSLRDGAVRPALSFLVRVDDRGEVRGSELVHSTIRIARRLTYEQADALIALGGGAPRLEEPLDPFTPREASAEEQAAVPAGAERAAPGLARAARIARALLERRAEAGALILKSPDLEVKVRGGEVRLRRIEPWTAAWVLVSETMILANGIAAEWLSSRGIPALYRRQAAPEQRLSLPRAYEPAAAAQARRQIKRTEVGLTPGPHAGLGLKVYVQVTSPLRRYQDLAGHRQLRAALHDEPLPFDAETLWQVAAATDEGEKTAREVERGTREYWLLRHFERLPADTVLDAVITRAEERRTLIELVDYVFVTNLVPRSGHKPGRRLKVVIDAVNPRGGRLVVREVGG